MGSLMLLTYVGDALRPSKEELWRGEPWQAASAGHVDKADGEHVPGIMWWKMVLYP